MTIFDAPSRDFSEVRRQKTNTPLQALALQNDIQVLEATRVMAQNVLSAVPRVADPVREVFEIILIRPPSGDEADRLEGYFREVLANFESHPEDAGKLVATGEYRQLDTDPATTAALMLTAQVVYNLDETITKE
jgi:hypothetical protein